MDTQSVVHVGERLAKLAFIGPESGEKRKKRDDDDDEEPFPVTFQFLNGESRFYPSNIKVGDVLDIIFKNIRVEDYSFIVNRQRIPIIYKSDTLKEAFRGSSQVYINLGVLNRNYVPTKILNERDDNESRETRQRLSCPDGHFEKIPTKFNETLLNRQKQENHCKVNSSNRSYCCDFETCPEGYIEVTNKGKSELEKNLLDKYCYGREKDNEGNLSYCCNKFDGKLWDPNDKAKDFISYDEIDTENPRSFVTLYPCKQRLGYDESTRQELIKYFFFEPGEYLGRSEQVPEDRDKCFASNTQIDFIYRGDYRNDEPYGDDFEVWYDSNIDFGTISSYLTKCGKGTINKMITKNDFTGYYENGEPIMKKKFTGNIDTYKGELLHGFIHGRGKMTYGYGDIESFEGDFYAGVPKKGKMTYHNDDVYEGEFDHRRTGIAYTKGKMTYHYGNVYEGEFKGTKPNGKGIMKFANDVYDGEFENGYPMGKGKMYYKNGYVYNGEFKDGKQDGKGEMIWPNGAFHRGIFKDDTLIRKLRSGGYPFYEKVLQEWKRGRW